MFAGNWPAMKAAGIIRGAYHFVGLPLPSTSPSNWNDDIHSQVDHSLAAIGPLQSGDLPPALDFEDGDSPARWKALISSNRAGALAIVREFIAYTTAQLGGTKPIIYTGNFWWGELGDPTQRLTTFPFPPFRCGLVNTQSMCMCRRCRFPDRREAPTRARPPISRSMPLI